MSFLEYDKYAYLDPYEYTSNVSDKDIEKALGKEIIGVDDFLAFLSGRARKHLERIAARAHSETLKNFGRTIQLYTPLYLSNYCVNQCVYCGFNASNSTPRKKLKKKEVKEEAAAIAETGLKHILILTGDSKEESPVSYIADCIKIIKKYFSSIAIETYALTLSEYKQLVDVGIDGVTIYQEVYDKKIYDDMHITGPKKDYAFRLEAPERALSANVRTLNLGVLLGLGRWVNESFMLARHAEYLQNKFPAAEISVSIPRIRPQVTGFKPPFLVTDTNIVQIILALRLFLPRSGITLSTRENPTFRENLIPLGITRMSAGSVTAVGGHTINYEKDELEQFSISDTRSVKDIKKMLLEKGYQPVFKDWLGI